MTGPNTIQEIAIVIIKIPSLHLSQQLRWHPKQPSTTRPHASYRGRAAIRRPVASRRICPTAARVLSTCEHACAGGRLGWLGGAPACLCVRGWVVRVHPCLLLTLVGSATTLVGVVSSTTRPLRIVALVSLVLVWAVEAYDVWASVLQVACLAFRSARIWSCFSE